MEQWEQEWNKKMQAAFTRYHEHKTKMILHFKESVKALNEVEKMLGFHNEGEKNDGNPTENR
jgi:hypothetical protein